MRIRSLLIILVAIVLGLWWFLSPPEEKAHQNDEVQTEEAIAPADSLVADIGSESVEREVIESNLEATLENEAKGRMGILNILCLEGNTELPMQLSSANLSLGTGTPTGNHWIPVSLDEEGKWSGEVPIGKFNFHFYGRFLGDDRGFGHDGELLIQEQEESNLVLTVPEAFPITVRMVDLHGSPIVGQELNVMVNMSTERYNYSANQKINTNQQGEVSAYFCEGELRVFIREGNEDFAATNWQYELTRNDQGRTLVVQPLARKKVLLSVMDSIGNPVEGAKVFKRYTPLAPPEVRISPYDNDREGSLTDAEGLIELSMIQLDARLEVSHVEYRPTEIIVLQQEVDAVVVLESGNSLTGVVLDGAGEAVAKAKVYAFNKDDVWDSPSDVERGSDWKMTETDENGEFMIAGINPEGKQYVLASAEGYAAYAHYSKKFEQHLIITLQPELSLFGLVQDQAKTPVSGVLVEVRGVPIFEQNSNWQTTSYYLGTYRQRTDETGSFRFPRIGNGVTHLFATPGSTRDFTTVVKATPSDNPILITLGEMSEGYTRFKLKITNELGGGVEASILQGLFHKYSEGIGGTSGRHLGVTNPEGVGYTRPFRRDTWQAKRRAKNPEAEFFAFVEIKSPGYVPIIVSIDSLPDGEQPLERTLEKAVYRVFHLVDSLGISELAEVRFEAALATDSMFALSNRQSFQIWPSPFLGVKSVRGESTYWSLPFEAWPESGGVLLLKGPNSMDTIRFSIPAGTGAYPIHLSEDQMRILKLIE